MGSEEQAGARMMPESPEGVNTRGGCGGGRGGVAAAAGEARWGHMRPCDGGCFAVTTVAWLRRTVRAHELSGTCLEGGLSSDHLNERCGCQEGGLSSYRLYLDWWWAIEGSNL